MQHPRNSFSDGDVKVGINANGLRFTVPMQFHDFRDRGCIPRGTGQGNPPVLASAANR